MFSDKAWHLINPIYNKIISHSFNQELEKGTLNKDTFDFYKKQDAYYLKRFSKALTLLASMLDDSNDVKMVLNLAGGVFEEDLSSYDITIKEISPSNFAYTEFLLSTSHWGSRGELSAALLPCFWIYLEVAKSMKENSTTENPFSSWIHLYNSESSHGSVDDMVHLTNRLYRQAPDNEQEKMFLVFEIAAQLELRFWDDSYHKRRLFDG